MTNTEIKALHIAGIPPGVDPQRFNELFAEYKLRMNANGLNPDIDDGESDVDYAIRIASYSPAIQTLNITASYALNSLASVSSTTATTATTATSALLQSTFNDWTGSTDTLLAGSSSFALAVGA